MIGDTMETDVLGGVQMGYRTALVLSGGTRAEDLANYAYCPDLVLESVAELADPQRRLEDIFPPPLRRADDTPDLGQWLASQAQPA
jgi:NagD protein